MKTPTIGTSLTLPGETPIQANRRLCEEGGRDTLPERMGTAIYNFLDALNKSNAAKLKPAHACPECGEEMEHGKGENSPEIDYVREPGWACACGHFIADEKHDTANEI